MAEDIVLGARQLSNPQNVKPKLDTDAPDAYTPPKGYKMDVSNPPAADLGQHPLEKHFEKPKGARHQLGKAMPKATISDN